MREQRCLPFWPTRMLVWVRDLGIGHSDAVRRPVVCAFGIRKAVSDTRDGSSARFDIKWPCVFANAVRLLSAPP